MLIKMKLIREIMEGKHSNKCNTYHGIKTTQYGRSRKKKTAIKMEVSAGICNLCKWIIDRRILKEKYVNKW